MVLTDAGQESALASLDTLYLGTDAARATAYPVTEAAWMPRGWKIKVEGIDGDTAVKGLVGQAVFADRAALPETAEDEYYLGDLIGASVIDAATGTTIGKFVCLESGEDQAADLGHDRWWLDIAGTRRAVPATKRFIERVDVRAHAILVKNLTELP